MLTAVDASPPGTGTGSSRTDRFVRVTTMGERTETSRSVAEEMPVAFEINGFGYAVFGKVTSGMPVVNKIKAVKTGIRGQLEDVPLEAVVILDITKKK